MITPPEIPFGYRQIQGRAQKGDGVWDGERFRKARKDWPSTEPAIIIRRIEPVQTEIPGTQPVWED